MELLVTAVITIHLLAINLAGAGPIVAAWVDWRGSRRNKPELQNAGLRLARWSMAAAALGVALGFAAWFALACSPPRERGSFWELLDASVTAVRWRFIAAEIVFYFACMFASVLLWNRYRRRWLCRFNWPAGTVDELAEHADLRLRPVSWPTSASMKP